ncbi:MULTISPECIES: ribosome biogenesis GTPase Der [unclassified Campylobacter]|uniref:ribosome biogenesis GTPase Der n=1 Tax=unclassified Campylobacter TaxID=2593542 RepID=UPI00123836E5|nr:MULTISPECIES: ribosome biogenesis GTPase Der [unclassified Campylobacter]KAA6228460.1 ribosome biogenesis GTPase Der [Campylobacter sp. LR185c]KAA6228947.1 ribosome biogenesis GTPase Der [Campylobacter sp. LR196d]KAA6229432.1 ribosome biogenesis GTPase Der [Campylobacter sp. LR286c]KAA6229898.1 ribosome biogenesis GTPase Der [Campylobacter sp. LR264d]KAA6234111.1 ribosome biogenesis GTPase Der [Campylobacter sp. LR291e]
MKNIIIIGKPNVGKSSLFNRLLRKRIAITSEISGTTRDINKVKIQIGSKSAFLIDSGGLDESNILFKKVQTNTLKMVHESDIILYMVDGKKLPDDEDRKIFYSLKKLNKPMALLINKVDNKKDEERTWEFANFGIKEIFSLSVSHNIGIDELCTWLEKFLDDATLVVDNDECLEDFLENLDEKDIDENHIKVAIVGRVNVGKSSLLNALVKENRSVVSEIEGTTIDPVNESIIYNNKTIEFIDTAGIRKRGKIEGLEKFGLNRTQKMLENAHIALLVLDASQGFNELDERIAGLISKYFLGVIIVLNKWDKSTFDFDKVSKELRLDRFKFLAFAPIISVSALSGKRVHVIFEKILNVFENFIQKMQTSKLNEIIQEATKTHPLPHDKGKLVKIYYATQYEIAPPKIALIMNRPKTLHFSYKRYLQNKLRSHFCLEGVPLILATRKRGEKEEN